MEQCWQIHPDGESEPNKICGGDSGTPHPLLGPVINWTQALGKKKRLFSFCCPEIFTIKGTGFAPLPRCNAVTRETSGVDSLICVLLFRSLHLRKYLSKKKKNNQKIPGNDIVNIRALADGKTDWMGMHCLCFSWGRRRGKCALSAFACTTPESWTHRVTKRSAKRSTTQVWITKGSAEAPGRDFIFYLLLLYLLFFKFNI